MKIDMMLIKKVGEHILVMNETLEVVKDFPDATFTIQDETVIIKSKGKTAVELPKSQTGVLYL